MNTPKEQMNLSKTEALNQIAQMSDCGSPELTIIRMKDIAVEALKEASKDEWVRVEDGLPPIDESDEWNKKTNQSIEVWTYSDFGMKQGRYYHHKEHSLWTIDGASSSKGITVTHWMPLPQPPKQ